MIKAIQSYLAVQRTAGFAFCETEYFLRSFAQFAAARQQTHVRTATAIAWASESESVAQRHRRYQTVFRFARYIRLEDQKHELPPTNHFGYRKTRRVPYIYSRVEIDRLILAATQLRPPDTLRPHTYAALLTQTLQVGMLIGSFLLNFQGFMA